MKAKRNYHMSLTRAPTVEGAPLQGPPYADWWRCDYCGVQGRYDDIRSTQCSHVYSVCKTCGGDPNSNECKPDCAAVLGALADAVADGAYLAGTHHED